MGIVIAMPPMDATINEIRTFCKVNGIQHHHKNGMAVLRDKIEGWFRSFQKDQEVHTALIWLKRRNTKMYRVLDARIKELESASRA